MNQNGDFQNTPAVELVERYRLRPVTLIRKDSPMTVENIHRMFGSCHVAICDVNLNELVTRGKPIIGGYRMGNILNIDHHFEGDPRFTRHVSSTNLAIDYVKAYGIIDENVVTVINHVDCDAVLSSGILTGTLEPLDVFGEAAIAADHTGEPNEIADLLQSLEGERDVELSIRNLALYLSGQPIEQKAVDLLFKRLQDREESYKLVESGFSYTEDGKIAYLETDLKNLDSAFFLLLLPDMELIVVFCPLNLKDEKGDDIIGTQAKVRLGLAAPIGRDVRNIVPQFDRNFGARWNAGSNERLGGMTMTPSEYISKLIQAVGNLE